MSNLLFLKKPKGFKAELEAVGCLCTYQNKIILLKRNKSRRVQPNKWGFPGGAIEPGETPLQAICREIWEETGIEVLPKELHQLFVAYVELADGFKYTYTFFFVSFAKQPAITVDRSEHTKGIWVTPKKARKMPLFAESDKCLDLAGAWQ